MKRILLCLGLTIVLASPTFAAPKCHGSEVWECVEQLINWMHTLPKRSLPETPSELDGLCTAVSTAVDCALKYRDNCLTPIQKELQTIVSEGILDLKSAICDPSSSIRQNYAKHAPCLNKVSQSDEVVELIQYILATIERTHNVPTNEILTYTCCGYRKIYNKYIKLGNDNCGAEATQSVLDVIKMGVSELPDVLCSGFEGTEPRCTAVLPPDGSKPSGDAKGIEAHKFLQHLFKQWLE